MKHNLITKSLNFVVLFLFLFFCSCEDDSISDLESDLDIGQMAEEVTPDSVNHINPKIQESGMAFSETLSKTDLAPAESDQDSATRGAETIVAYGNPDSYLKTCLNSWCQEGFYWNYNSNSNIERLFSKANSSIVEIMSITRSGSVGIGITWPQYKLDVHGTIRAEEVIVETFTPDYVFAKNYDLWTPQEIENYIEKEKHLPGVPSAADVDAHGVSIGESQAILLQKIEELTLHMISQNKRIIDLEKQNAIFAKQIQKADKL